MPLSRLETLEWLLKTFNEAQEPLQRGAGGAGGSDFGDRLLLMPQIWHEGSYKAVESAMKRLRAAQPRLYWHVRQRYLLSETRISEIRQTKRGVKGKYTVCTRVVEEKWHPKVDMRLVREGLEWLEAEIATPLYLPREILAVVG